MSNPTGDALVAARECDPVEYFKHWLCNLKNEETPPRPYEIWKAGTEHGGSDLTAQNELKAALRDVLETFMIDTADGRCLAAQSRARKALGLD